MRFRRSGIRKIFATASKNFIFAYLKTSQPLPDGHGSESLAPDHFATSTGLLDLLQSRFRENMRLHCNLSGQLAGTQHLQPRAQLLDRTELEQTARIEGFPFELF